MTAFSGYQDLPNEEMERALSRFQPLPITVLKKCIQLPRKFTELSRYRSYLLHQFAVGTILSNTGNY
jgi:hypothetical protein